jgi:hypothetical protein
VPVLNDGVNTRREKGKRRRENDEKLRIRKGFCFPSPFSLLPFPLYSSPMKECPMCGENMRLSVREIRDAVPGAGQTTGRVLREWICPECDYFEEAETGEGT